MKRFVAIASIEPGGHYTTVHHLNDPAHGDPSMLKIWVKEMSKEIGFCSESSLILRQGTLYPIDGLTRVEMASFAFGVQAEYHCIVIFVKL
jgi:hypothetical protein